MASTVHKKDSQICKKDSQICALSQDGKLIERRVRTEAQRFAEVLGSRPRARILIESATESEWVARCLEGLGHEVIVADPNLGPMYAQWRRKVKTDRRDARALTEACLLGAYRRAHRLSDEQSGSTLVHKHFDADSAKGSTMRATWRRLQNDVRGRRAVLSPSAFASKRGGGQ